MELIVQKFGGVTLATTAKIKAVAERVKTLKDQGQSMIVVVSAMGQTTDSLLAQVREISSHPELREADLLLSTGELISAALLSIALNEINCPAVSLTGSQAGILTDLYHANASIESIAGLRIDEALKNNQVVILPGFQGVNSLGDVTTLGRGGSDTTAVAVAARMQAHRCEILKDVSAIFTADPRLVPAAVPIQKLSYDCLLEMTYWGAKVLQYRSVEIAKNFRVPLYIGPAHAFEQGTLVEENIMIEDSEVLALNSHETVLRVRTQQKTLMEALNWFRVFLLGENIVFPQMLHSEISSSGVDLFMTGPKEIMVAIGQALDKKDLSTMDSLCSVTTTCRGSTRPDLLERIVGSLENHGIQVIDMLVSSISVTVFIAGSSRQRALSLLHTMVKV